MANTFGPSLNDKGARYFLLQVSLLQLIFLSPPLSPRQLKRSIEITSLLEHDEHSPAQGRRLHPAQGTSHCDFSSGYPNSMRTRPEEAVGPIFESKVEEKNMGVGRLTATTERAEIRKEIEKGKRLPKITWSGASVSGGPRKILRTSSKRTKKTSKRSIGPLFSTTFA